MRSSHIRIGIHTDRWKLRVVQLLLASAEENIPDEYFHENFDETLPMSTTKAPVIESDQKTPVQSKPEQKATVKYKKI